MNFPGREIISIHIGASSLLHATLSVTVVMDGTKLPFLILKGAPSGSIERSFDNILLAGTYGCAQRKAWMDDSSMKI